MRFYTPMRSARRPAAAEIEPRGGVARSAWPRCSPPAPCHPHAPRRCHTSLQARDLTGGSPRCAPSIALLAQIGFAIKIRACPTRLN